MLSIQDDIYSIIRDLLNLLLNFKNNFKVVNLINLFYII